MAGGYATQETVKRCLSVHVKNRLLRSRDSTTSQDTGAGNLLAQWLWSTGMQRSLKFLSDHSLTHLMVKALVADGRHDIIHAWLRADGDAQRSIKSIHSPNWDRARLLLDLLKSEVIVGKGTQSAFNIFLGYVQETRDAHFRPRDRRMLLGLSGHYLMHHICDEVKDRKVNVSLYNHLVASANEWSRDHSFELAWLALYHPDHPDPDPTISFLKRLSSETLGDLPQHRRLATADVALQAAQEFLQQERQSEAVWLMGILKEHFAELIGVEAQNARADERRDDAVPEWANLRLLDSLALG